MALPDVREQLIAKLNDLSDEQVEEVGRYVEVMLSRRKSDDYDPNNDPAIGFFSASPDLASRTKEILRAEFGVRKKHESTENL